MKILGVDLGSYSIKIAELEASSKGFVLSNFFEIQLSVDPNRDRHLQIIEALRNLAANYEPASTRWVIGVSQHEVSTHFKRFPFRERPKIQKSLAFELEEDIPLDIDETIFDFKIVEFAGPSTDVLTIACPKDTIEASLQLAKDCGFDPEIVSVEGMALANIYTPWNATPPEVSSRLKNPESPIEADETSQAPAEGAKVVLHIGHKKTIVLVYRGPTLIATRSILWGGLDVAENLSRTFKVSLFEGMKMLTSRSFILMNSAGATQDQLRLSQCVASQVDQLLKDLRLLLLDVKTAFNLNFEEVELLGGTSQIQNLAPYITQGLEIPTNANFHNLTRYSSRIQIGPQIEAAAPIAVGLAIEGMKRQRNPAINLRKSEFARENLTLKRFWEQWRVPAQIMAASFVAFTVFSMVREQIATNINLSADERVSEAAQKVAGLKGSAASETNLRKFIKAQRTLLANNQALAQLDGYASALDILARLSEKMPAKSNPGIDLSLFELDNEDLTIKGKATTPSQVSAIEQSLGEIAQAKSLSRMPGDQAAGFAFKLKVKRKE